MRKKTNKPNKVVKRRRKRPIPKKSTTHLLKRKLVRRGLPLVIATALTLGSAHFAMKKVYGISYSKRIPIVRQFAVGGKKMTFVFGKHTRGHDLSVVERQLQAAKKAGKPFNTFVFECADMPHAERKAAEAQLNNLALSYKKALNYLNDPDKRMRDAATREVKKIQKIAQQNLGEFDAKKVGLCAKYDLHIKYGESYSKKMLETMEEASRVSTKASQLGDYQNEIIVRAMHLKVRNAGISRTLPLALKEARKKLNVPPKAIFYVGATHGGTQSKRGVFRTFDRNQLFTTRSLGKGIEFGPDVPEHKTKQVTIIANEVMKLAEKSNQEIMAYRATPQLLEQLKSLEKPKK
jgi:hypothetical protein